MVGRFGPAALGLVDADGGHAIGGRRISEADRGDQWALLEPGQIVLMKIALMKDTALIMPKDTGELKIAVKPARAAVFIWSRQSMANCHRVSRLPCAPLHSPRSHDLCRSASSFAID